MSKRLSLIDQLKERDSRLYETFKDRLLVETKNGKFFLIVHNGNIRVSLDDLNKLQDFWAWFLSADEIGAEVHPLLVYGTRFESLSITTGILPEG